MKQTINKQLKPQLTRSVSVESSSLEEFLMLYHDAEGGLVVFEEDYSEFVQGISSLMDKAEQRGSLAGSKAEREGVVKMCEEMKKKLKHKTCVYPCSDCMICRAKSYYNQALSDLQKKEEG